MNAMLTEINEIPMKAREFMKLSSSYVLPLRVPYLGMGSSYFAALAFKYIGIDIYPEIASEYFYYLANENKFPKGVILSQSGRSSETLWCKDLFDEYVAITNDPDSPLGQSKNATTIVPILAGVEQTSSSKTYINTLLALFKGFGLDANHAVGLLQEKISEYDQLGKKMATEVFDLITHKEIQGMYVVGSGPNVATAYEASLILSESSKLCFSGMPMAQYDHGHKETAANSIVIQIVAKGKVYERAQKLTETVAKAGAHVITVEEPAIEEKFSVLHNIVVFNYMAYYLTRKLGIPDTFFSVGGKVTEV
ncbi:SIS domain-containing protein [Catalinimonas niigatensis]|uniref:SIS domain-containing protein n=1 Tax=Catalinimonas niigatensis TaxID=1397264 RepID=UPI002666C4F6|nr:hypothetical protein [Catalinimonas niigatensis]WPP50542.1 hypothetical protein PZB72_28155 [Catalinimonas niigatensis]